MQVGPRIRVGGSIGKAGQKLKIGVGKLAQPVGKVVSLINPMLGTAISTAGDVLDTSDGKFNFGNAAKNAALQYGGAKVARGVASKIGGLFKGGDGVGSVGAAGEGSYLNDIADASKSMDGGRYRSLGKFFGGADGFGMDDVLKYGSAIGEGYGAYHRSNAQDKLTRMSEDEWRRRQPLRDAGMKALLDDSKPDTSSTFADPYAPTGRYRRINVGSGGY